MKHLVLTLLIEREDDPFCAEEILPQLVIRSGRTRVRCLYGEVMLPGKGRERLWSVLYSDVCPGIGD